VATSVDMALLIPHIDVIHPTLEGENNVNVWMVQSQTQFDVVCNFHAPFTKYASCTCE